MQLIGIAFGYPSAEDIKFFNLKDELQFARIEQGDPMQLSTGRILSGNYWRKWNIPLEERTELAEKILEAVKAHRPREITGFTLFYNESRYTKADGTPVEPGFQMSVRRKNENGWDVQRITAEQASVVFRLLENSGHPDGPWTLVGNERVDVRDSYIVPQSAIEGWPEKEPLKEMEYFEEIEGRTLLQLIEENKAARRSNREAREAYEAFSATRVGG